MRTRLMRDWREKKEEEKSLIRRFAS